jgi:transposase
VINIYTEPPAGATVLCLDELGPVIPRTYPPTPGWSPDGRRIKAPMEYSRGLEKTWIYGALRVHDGQARTLTAPARNTAGYLALLQEVEAANPLGELYLISDNLSSHQSGPIREWLAARPRVHQVFIPTRASWLNLVEGWWRLFRRAALAGQSFVDSEEIALATRVATRQLNAHAKPWVWGRPPPPPRRRRWYFTYCI